MRGMFSDKESLIEFLQQDNVQIAFSEQTVSMGMSGLIECCLTVHYALIEPRHAQLPSAESQEREHLDKLAVEIVEKFTKPR